MDIHADKRHLKAEPQPRIHARLVAGQARWMERDLGRARDFDAIHTSRHYRLECCATVTEYGEKLGYDARQVRRWVNVGLILRAEPRSEGRLRDTRLSMEKVEILAPVYRNPARLWEGDDWMALAEYCTPRQLRRHVQRRIEEVAHGKTCQSRTITAPDDVWHDFARARDVLSSLAGRPLTQGETLGCALTELLDRKDPLRKAKRAKRKRRPAPRQSQGPSQAKVSAKRSRMVPADAEHLLWLRSRGVCEFPGCRCRRGLQMAHIHGFAGGGPQDVRNLVLLCRDHHTLFDAGKLDFTGWGEDGRPIFDVADPRPRAPP